MSDLWDIFVDHHLIHGLFHQIKRGEPQGIAIHFNGVKQHFPGAGSGHEMIIPVTDRVKLGPAVGNDVHSAFFRAGHGLVIF